LKDKLPKINPYPVHSPIYRSNQLAILIRGDYFRFGSDFIKKNNQTEIFFKKTETISNRLVSVRFGFLRQKPVQTGLAWFFRFGSVFCRFGSVFFGLGSVWFFQF
jgi:hypothetical protein